MLEEIAFGFNIIKIAFNAWSRIVVLSFEKNWKYIWL